MNRLIIQLAIGLSFLIFGFFLRRGRMLDLLAGFNTLNRKEKEKTDKKRLGRLTGNYFIVIGLVVLSVGVLVYLFPETKKLFIALEIIVLFLYTFMLVCMLNRKEVNSDRNENGKD
ncbi:MAG: DUF3784 domain-containing protein [Spirochaetales bacterium]|nr:DUF3784 domain-containing protein [Spirochaetales bacterium]